MFKLNAQNAEGTSKFEQIFTDYISMKEKQLEFIKEGLITVITPMTPEQHEKYHEKIVNKLTGLTKESILN